MKTIMVTGAAGDIGRAIVKALSGLNYHVIAVTRDKKSSTTLKNINNVTPAFADVTRLEDLRSLEKIIPEKIDWVIAAHGFIDPGTNLEAQKPEAIQETFNVNIISLVYLAQIFLKHITQGMIFISSTSGISANGRYLAYSASKAGVNSLAQGLARNRAGLKFVSLCPGPTLGTMRKKLGADGGQDPNEIAKTVSEIISSEEKYKSGDVVMVRDGKVTTESRIS